MLELQQESVCTFDWQGLSLLLLPEKAVFVPENKMLLIADPHFGKAAHFRKAGIPVPEELHAADLTKIKRLVEMTDTRQLVFLGDLFHSDFNSSWIDLEHSLDQLSGKVTIHLVKGNHDILPASIYRSSSWTIHEESYQVGPLLLTHEPMESVPDGLLNCCGHIHPGIRLRGSGRQQLMLPCFYNCGSQLILPAYGRFTGLVSMTCTKRDKVFAIAGSKVIPVNFDA
jgi:uncharacterized protein